MSATATIARQRTPSTVPRLSGASVVLGYLGIILRRFVAVVGAAGASTKGSRQHETYMETDNSTLRDQRQALRSFLTAQERKTQLEAPLGPDRKKAEDAVRQQADASRRKVDEDRRSLDKVRAEATETANGMMQSVNDRWNEVTSALRVADLASVISDPASFRVRSDDLGDPTQTLRRCRTIATEAQEAVHQALLELQKHKDKRLLMILGMAAVLILIAVVAVKFG